MQNKHFLGAIAMLVGCTIGAGILGLPYVVSKAGILNGIIAIIVVGIMFILIQLYLGEVVLRTKGNHQLTGYAEKYIGKTGKTVMLIGGMVSIYGALLAYTIGVGKSVNAIIPWSEAVYSMLFIAIMTIVIYRGLNAVEKSEIILDFLKLGIFAVICIWVLFSGRISIEPGTVSAAGLMLPYGVLLFAYAGLYVIPEMKEELKNNKEMLRNAIIIGTLIPGAIYLLFSLIFSGSGAGATEISTMALGQIFGQKMLLLANLFAILAMSTSFLALGLVLKDTYRYDYNTGKETSIILVSAIPLLLFIIGAREFIKVLDVTGAIGTGIQAVMILIMFHAAKRNSERKPEYSIKENIWLSIIIGAIFIAGTVIVVLKNI